MKNIFVLACLLISGVAFSQITTPAASQLCKVEQVVGLTTVNLEYSRPNVKDRTIFAADGLVPHGKLWRTGANRVTKFSFSDDVTINGSELKAGDYAILTTPNADNWQVHFHKLDSPYWTGYTEKEPALTVTALVNQIPWSQETFFISVQNITDNSATIDFLWDNTWVGLQLGVKVDETVMANIEQVLAGPTGGDYYNAASYYHSSGKDLAQALEWINMATDVAEPKFWQVRRKALILADMGKTKEAIKTAKKSMELAMAAGNDDYVAMNKKSIAEWSK
ncbi:MAG: DUF2911 domain-containing protein [Saprospiraceae bacterium]|nr:DUF2911 domain-containing protein [Bacteroidia bacterium]NNE16538.1 DUF2911 domain-containing protein [Saprospiraceae bacterium]NNL90768.1 DUF2911 domain-containing protein [Saprospiraceae bacterium]